MPSIFAASLTPTASGLMCSRSSTSACVGSPAIPDRASPRLGSLLTAFRIAARRASTKPSTLTCRPPTVSRTSTLNMFRLPRRYAPFKKPKGSFPFLRFVLPWNGDYFLMHDPNALKIYIDGSAYRNPGHEGGLAGVAEFPDSLNREPEVIFEESYR